MRDILFRGKRVDNNEWIKGLIWKKKYHDGKRVFISYFQDKDDNETRDVVKIETVGQFTGILDDCAERIFEGDIVEVALGGVIYYGVIEWQPSEARFLIYIKDAATWIPLDDQTVHIVGNIHDNPELLEVAE